MSGCRLMFWSDWGVAPRIERAHLDGTGRSSIISDHVGWPNGLCIDTTAKKIYWADARLDRIESAGLRGENRKQLVTNLPHPFGLAVVRLRQCKLLCYAVKNTNESFGTFLTIRNFKQK